MRWEALFDDLEAQLDAAEAAELSAEVADRTRREVGLLRLVDRLRPALGHPVRLGVLGAGAANGRLLAVDPDWALLEETGGREALLPLPAVLWVSGVGAGSAPPGAEGDVAARLDLRYALRGLVRDRSVLTVVLLDGTSVAGTADRVGADFVEVTEHPLGEPPRRGAVLGVRTLPLTSLTSLAALRRA